MPTDDRSAATSGGEFGTPAPEKRDRTEPAAAKVALAVGVRVLVTRGYSKGERGVITNSPQRVFNGWTVRLDNGRIFGADSWKLRAARSLRGA